MKQKVKSDKPAIHSQTSSCDVEAVSILTGILSHNGRVAPDLRYRDTWPNIDGYLELTLEDGAPDGKLEAQVKRIHIENGNEITFSFDDDKFLNYCRPIRDLPILFVGVDLEEQKAYWVEMSTTYVASLTSRTIKIPSDNLIVRGSTTYYNPWKRICDERKQILQKNLIASGRGEDGIVIEATDPQRSAIEQLFTSELKSELLSKNQLAVDSIVKNIKEKILLYEGHLFLVSPTYIGNSKVREAIRKNLDVTLQQEELFIDELTKQQILSKTGDIVVFNEDALGQEKILYLAKNNLINIGKIYDSLPDVKVRKAILKKAVGILGVNQVEEFFNELSDNFLDEIEKFKNNDDIVVNLELLEEYSFRVPSKTIEIVNKVLSSTPLPAKTYDGKLGKFKGASNDRVLIEALDVLNTIRYLEIKDVLKIAISLSINENSDVKKKALELIKHIAEYNIFAMRKIGYYPQRQVVTFLQSLAGEEIKTSFSALLELGREILSSEFEGSEMTDYKTFTWTFGPLNASEELQNIRNDVAEIIKNAYLKSTDSKSKIQLLNVLEEGTRTPIRGKYTDELENLIITYVNDLMPFYVETIVSSDLLVIHEIESQLHWFIKRFGDNKINLNNELRQKLNENNLYQIFRVFYGYDYNFDEELPWREAREKRERIIDEYVERISEINCAEWERNILEISKNYTPDDPGKFQYFNSFLYKYAKKKPSLAIRLVDNTISIEPFLTHLVLGLWESELHEEIRNILLNWGRGAKELSMMAGLFWFTKIADIEFMRQIYSSALKAKDIYALTTLARSLVVTYREEKEIKTLFLDVIKSLTELGSTRWVFNFYAGDSVLFKTLSDKETDIILNNLLLLEDISHDAEEILLSFAENFPEKIVNFFYKRIKKQVGKKKDSRYDAVPYDFHELPQVLVKKTDLILNEVFKWFKEKDWLFQFDGPRFLKEIFPSMNEPLRDKLLLLIKDGGKTNAEIVIRVLRAYEGESFTHPIVKAFVKKYLRRETSTTYKDYLTELFIALSATGVVSGEYGLPNAYKQKKEEIQSWKSDKSKSIQVFIKKYEDYLDKDIAYHTKRADEDIELMKRGAM